MTSHVEYNRETTAEEVVSAFSEQIRDKTVLMTGVSPNGLGEAMAIALAKASPACLILTARSTNKAHTVALKLADFFAPVVKVLQLDLSSLASIRRAAAQLDKYTDYVDVVINNAGVMGVPEHQLSEDGVEMHLATNWLGHFVFTNLIMRKLDAGAARNPEFGARLVNITNPGYALTPFRFSDFNYNGNVALPASEETKFEATQAMGMMEALPNEDYVPLLAYFQSATANMLFTAHLAKCTKDKGLSVFSATPGVVETKLQRYMPEGFLNPHVFYKTPSQGAATFLVAAFDPLLKGHSGAFLDNCQVVQALPHSTDGEAAAKLWALGEQLAGEKYEV